MLLPNLFMTVASVNKGINKQMWETKDGLKMIPPSSIIHHHNHNYNYNYSHSHHYYNKNNSKSKDNNRSRSRSKKKSNKSSSRMDSVSFLCIDMQITLL